jgi:aldose 1-epimerase
MTPQMLMMHSSLVSLLLAAATVVAGQTLNSSYFRPFTGDAFAKYTISAKGINATVIPLGARFTNIYVPDSSGTPQDIVVGYDDPHNYTVPNGTVPSYFGAVVGRYANRIKNGTFSVNGQTYHIPENEHGGEDTLHGGNIGYDQRNWSVVSNTTNSITFALYDEAFEGFPGNVLNVATYTVTDQPSLISRLVSIPIDAETPIMLANHIYWNLGAYVNTDAMTILNSTLWMPYADRFIGFDGIEVPTGAINLTNGTALDFTSPVTIGAHINETINGCGTNCTGYDNAFILDRPRYAMESPDLGVLQWWSPDTGIQMTLETNQQSLQLYTCDTQNGSIPVKAGQQHGNTTSFYDQYGCMVIETQDVSLYPDALIRCYTRGRNFNVKCGQWIDAINQPQWGRQDYQLFSPTTYPALNYQKYSFSTANSWKGDL